MAKTVLTPQDLTDTPLSANLTTTFMRNYPETYQKLQDEWQKIENTIVLSGHPPNEDDSLWLPYPSTSIGKEVSNLTFNTMQSKTFGGEPANEGISVMTRVYRKLVTLQRDGIEVVSPNFKLRAYPKKNGVYVSLKYTVTKNVSSKLLQQLKTKWYLEQTKDSNVFKLGLEDHARFSVDYAEYCIKNTKFKQIYIVFNNLIYVEKVSRGVSDTWYVVNLL